jgi:hypothetical protein
MKRSIVLLFLISIAFGTWRQSGEIALPKGIQVNDLAIDYYGENWILSTSSILKFEGSAKNPQEVHEIRGARLLTILDENIYLVDNVNRLIRLDLSEKRIVQLEAPGFDAPRQIYSTISDEDMPLLFVLEPTQLKFVSNRQILGSINTNAQRFSIIPLADYNNTEIPLYTQSGNRIYSWTGGTSTNIAGYESRLFFSASNNILDFAADKNGDLYILFSDSIVVLEQNGDYKRKINIDHLPIGSRILSNPANNNLVLFDNLGKNLKTLSGTKEDSKGDIITLNKNRPNPVDNYTEIEFTLNQSLNLTITVYNLIGEPVKVLSKGLYPKGVHRVIWHAEDERGNLVPNGVYFYRLESKKGVAIRQLIVLR